MTEKRCLRCAHRRLPSLYLVRVLFTSGVMVLVIQETSMAWRVSQLDSVHGGVGDEMNPSTRPNLRRASNASRISAAQSA